MKLERGNIARFTIDREHYGLKPLLPHHCIFLVGKVLSIEGDMIRTKFIDLFGDANEHTITIKRNRIIEVI